jgi:hypothetical protein
MYQYCVYTSNNQYAEVAQWLVHNGIKNEIHLNRIRFWVPEGLVLTEFLLKYSDTCVSVEERLDNNYAIA